MGAAERLGKAEAKTALKALFETLFALDETVLECLRECVECA